MLSRRARPANLWPESLRREADERFAFVETPRRGLAVGFFLTMQKPPTSDMAVREPINWALDRKPMKNERSHAGSGFRYVSLRQA